MNNNAYYEENFAVPNPDDIRNMYVHMAREMFEAYTEDAGGKTWDGKPIPGWFDEKMTDEVRNHWIAAAKVAVKVYEQWRPC